MRGFGVGWTSFAVRSPLVLALNESVVMISTESVSPPSAKGRAEERPIRLATSTTAWAVTESGKPGSDQSIFTSTSPSVPRPRLRHQRHALVAGGGDQRHDLGDAPITDLLGAAHIDA